MAALETGIQPNTRVLYFETPGSLTFEMPDCAGLYDFAKAHGLTSIVDTTWPTSLYYPAIARGADISLAAGTKYYGGHSDTFFGIVVGNERVAGSLRHQSRLMGNHMAPDDVYLALRGMRTLKVRLDAISASALQVAQALREHPKIAQVRHPALPECPGHEHWRAQFDGASGLFAIALQPEYDDTAAIKVVEALDLFAIGYSWGGYESLAVYSDPTPFRAVGNWRDGLKGLALNSFTNWPGRPARFDPGYKNSIGNNLTMIDQVKWDDRGLVPAIAQADGTGEVLMMAWMNGESLKSP